MALTAAQNTQVKRLPLSYFKAPEGSEMTDAEYKAMTMAKLEHLTPDQLRARVNVTGVSWGHPIVINYSAQNDYISAEQEAIGQGLWPGDKWAYRMAEIVAGGPSLEQRVVVLEGEVQLGRRSE